MNAMVKPDTDRATLIEHSGGLAVRQAEWKLIPRRPGAKRALNTDTDTGNNPDFQLYNLTTDLGETNNLAQAHPEKIDPLRALLESEKAKGFPPAAKANAKKP